MLGLLVLSLPARADLVADYQFNDHLTSSVPGAPALVDLGSGSFVEEDVDGVTSKVFQFAENTGFSLDTTGVIPSSEYTIVLLFALDQVSHSHKIIDFQNRTHDKGLYVHDRRLGFFDNDFNSGQSITPGSFVQVVLTRDASGEVAGYVDGTLYVLFQDSENDAVAPSVLHLFRENTGEGDISSGSVARIRVYDSALTGLQISGLDRLAGNTTGTVNFDPATLRDLTQITVTLSDTTELNLTRTRLLDYGPSTYVWIGTVDGELESSVVLSANDGVVVGTIQTLSRWWELELELGIVEPIEELNVSALDFSGEDSVTYDPIFQDSFETASPEPQTQTNKTVARALAHSRPVVLQSSPLAADLPVCVDEPSRIDVLAAYTPQAAASSGNIEATIRYAIATANESFARSAILVGEPATHMELNLVHSHQVDFVEPVVDPDDSEANSQAMENALIHARKPDDLVMDELHDLREEHAADIVVLFVGTFGSGSNLGPDLYSELAFALVNVNFKNHSGIGTSLGGTGLIFTHEIAHEFGAKHDRYATAKELGLLDENLEPDETKVPDTGNYGFIHKDEVSWRTVMAYQDKCLEQTPVVDCWPTNVFSSPDLSFGGVPPGSVNEDNRAWLILGAPTVACYRQNPRIEDISFADEDLRNCVLETADSQFPKWTRAREVSSLRCINKGITDLGGLEYMLNLSNLILIGNDIVNIEALAPLTKLRVLDLNGGGGAAITPLSALAGLVNLEALAIAENQINDLSFLTNLTKLKFLALQINQVDDITVLETLTNLESLDLNGNGAIFPHSALSNLTNLRSLGVAGNEINDITFISNLTKLENISLQINSITSINPLQGMAALKGVDLNGNDIQDISVFADKTNLENLLLRGNRVSDVAPILGLPNIKYVDLRGQKSPPGLNCEQQVAAEGLQDADTTVDVDGFWNDPNDDPDEGNINCFP